MNLIEQLGGYEKAKEIVFDPLHPQMTHVSNDGRHWVNEEFAHIPEINEQMQGMIKISDIRHSLLEHRRQHNIFEMGDYIIHDGELKVFAMWSNAIDGCAYIGYAYAEDGEMAHKDEFRHASDEEIKAGKRLEVKSEN